MWMLRFRFSECHGRKLWTDLVLTSLIHALVWNLVDVSDIVKDCGFGVFTGALENGGSVRGINVEGQAKMPRKKIDASL